MGLQVVTAPEPAWVFGHTGYRYLLLNVDQAELEKQWTMGFTDSDISALTGVSNRTIRRRRAELGLRRTDRDAVSDEDLREVSNE